MDDLSLSPHHLPAVYMVLLPEGPLWVQLSLLLLLSCLLSLAAEEGMRKEQMKGSGFGSGSGSVRAGVRLTVGASTSVSPLNVSECASLGDWDPPVLQAEGDVVIGGLFPLHYLAPQPLHSYRSPPRHTQCNGFDHRAFRWMMTMVFAVEEINRNSTLLPGVMLGYRILDSCDHVHTSLRAALSLVTGSSETSRLLGTEDKAEERMEVPIAEPQSLEREIECGTPREMERDVWSESGMEEKIKKRSVEEGMGGRPCLARAPVPAVIGLASSSPTGAVAHTLGPFNIPLVSYFATCTCLTDKRVYPSFLRTVPSDLFQVRGLVQLVTHFGWRWVGTIGTQDDYSLYGIQAFSKQLEEQGGCPAFHLTIPTSPSVAQTRALADALQSSSARVVVVFATEGQLLGLLSELARRNVTGIQWVASEAWVTATLLTSPQFHHLLEGTVGFSFPGANIPGLRDFLLKVRPSASPGSEFVNMFWEDLFGCSLQFGEVGKKSVDSENILDSNPVENDGVSEPSPGVNTSRSSSPGKGSDTVGTLWGSGGENSRSTQGNPVCTGLEDLRDTDSSYTNVSQVRISYNVYKAVYTIAHALHQLLQCDAVDNSQVQGSCRTSSISFTPTQLLHHLKRVKFTNQFGEKVHFDSNGEPVPLYDIINWQKDSQGDIRFHKIGGYDGSAPVGEQLQMEESAIVWSGGRTTVPLSLCTSPCRPGNRQAIRTGEPRCCFDCLPCADGEISNQTGSTGCTKCPEYYWSDRDRVKCVSGVDDFLSFYNTMGIILVTLTLLGVVTTTIITAIFHRFRSTPIVKANNSELSFLLLLSLKLCFLCSLVFIGRPSSWACRFRQAAFGISFVICLSCLLVKTIVVLLAFRATVPGSSALKLFGPAQQRALILCTTAPQVCLCAGWLSMAPPYPFRNPFYLGTTGKVVLECKEPWPPGFYLVLGYIGLLASLCLLLAFLGRKLPDTFNEAKFITFSMLIFCAVWISFIPAYVSTPGKFTVAVEVFAILASSFGLLLCIFVPKCYIILLQPERNTKKGMTGKSLR